MTTDFQIPMTHMNLPPSEALNQIMDNLNHLNAIVNQAVTTIHSRIQQESQLLSSISQRIDKAYKKTALIASNPKRSTTVFAPSTYPSIKNSQPIKTGTNKPLIDTNTIHPIQPKRSKYNLSLKQRNQKPQNTETISLLQSINQKTTKTKLNTNTETKTLQNTTIPQWVSSVADCVIFDTNCNAYKSSENPETKRRRYRKRKKIAFNAENENKMADAPPSIGDKYYNLKTERKTYGERIKYTCVLDRPNMPKFQKDVNLFDTQNSNNIAVANDVQFIANNNGKQDSFIIPSDVLNERYMNMQFEYGDNITAPVQTEVNENEIKLDEKQEEKAEVISVNNYPTPKGIENENVVNNNSIHNYPTPLDVIEVEEKQNDSPQMNSKQPVIREVKAQNKSLHKEDVNIEEKKEIMVSNDSGKEAKKKLNKKMDNKNDKCVVRFVFDVNALKDAKKKLNKKKVDEENEKKNEVEKDENLQGNIFMAIKNLRKFHADSDDEEDDNGSFYDSD